jgi:2-dehydro-3-deoxygluconokinase
MSATMVSFGEIMLRLSPPGFERLLQTPQLMASFGGSEANMCTLAPWYSGVSFVTLLPATPSRSSAQARKQPHH